MKMGSNLMLVGLLTSVLVGSTAVLGFSSVPKATFGIIHVNKLATNLEEFQGKRFRSARFASFTQDSEERSKDEPERKAGNAVFQSRDVGTSTADDDISRDIPWSDAQEWALADNLFKYTVPVSLQNPATGKLEAKKYALWRTFAKEVSELTGYPPNVLQTQCIRSSKISEVPGVLPFLDNFEFAASGGVSGDVYGVPGLADGTRIETSQVNHVEITLPRGYIRTSDGSSAYELGIAKSDSLPSSLLDELQLKDRVGQAAESGGYMLSNVAKGGTKLASTVVDEIENPNAMLVQLGASTGLLLAGATAMNMLSHHLTVNVFWV